MMKRTLCLWATLAYFACLTGSLHPASAEDLAVQYRWHLSTDEQITIDDMALGQEGTLYDIVYAGCGITVTQTVTVPAFQDPVAPSYFGLIADPYEFASDSDRINNTAIQVSVSDPAPRPGNPDFPDIHQLETRVVGDQLHLTLTYSDSFRGQGLPAVDGAMDGQGSDFFQRRIESVWVCP